MGERMPGARTVGVMSASPYANGRCDRAAKETVGAIEEAGCRARLLFVRAYRIAPCRGCNACARQGACVIADDDMASLVADLDRLDGLVLISPVYFAGPPAQLKVVFDRLQQLWAARYALDSYPALPAERRRPLGLVAIGGGSDPFGSEPLVTICRSAMRMLDYELATKVLVVGEGDASAASCRAGAMVAQAALGRVPFGREPRAEELALRSRTSAGGHLQAHRMRPEGGRR